MIPTPPPNSITRPYRGLSMQEVEIPLADESAILEYLIGREVYRRTEWLLLANGDDHALVAVLKESFEPLFSPVTEARVLAAPDRTAWIEDASTDVGNATALAAAAGRSAVTMSMRMRSKAGTSTSTSSGGRCPCASSSPRWSRRNRPSCLRWQGRPSNSMTSCRR